MNKGRVIFLMVMLTAAFRALSAEAPTGNQVGQKMADFTLLDQTGKTKNFYDVAGGKKTLVYYFMGCCNHCVALLPKIKDVANGLPSRGIAVVGVQYYGNTEFCKFTAGKHQLVGTIFADSKGEICGRMGVGEFTAMTLDANGVILYRGLNVDPAAIKRSLGV